MTAKNWRRAALLALAIVGGWVISVAWLPSGVAFTVGTIVGVFWFSLLLRVHNEGRDSQ